MAVGLQGFTIPRVQQHDPGQQSRLHPGQPGPQGQTGRVPSPLSHTAFIAGEHIP